MGVCALFGFGPFPTVSANHDRPAPTRPSTVTTSSLGATTAATAGTPPAVLPTAQDVLPLGPRTRTTIPAGTTQVVVVSGARPESDVATVELYELVTPSWVRVAAWRGHIGRSGWTVHHLEGDLRTQVGTFTLSDAGGRRPDPGSGLPYYRSAAFTPPQSQPGFGDSTADAFDYVIAVDYNRVPGHSPLDSARPLGAARGGGIWIHVDHGGPTHGCVSIPLADVRYLLRHLSVTAHPVVVMGDAARLAR